MNEVCPEAGFRLHVTPVGGGEDMTKVTGTGLLQDSDAETATL